MNKVYGDHIHTKCVDLSHDLQWLGPIPSLVCIAVAALAEMREFINHSH